MIPLAPCADKGGYCKSTTSVCDTLCSEAHADRRKKARNGDHSCSSDGEKEEELMDMRSDAAIRTTH